MTGVESNKHTKSEALLQVAAFSSSSSSDTTAFRSITFDNSFDSQLEQVEYSSSFEEAEWDPVGFDLKKSSNPKWKKRNNKTSQKPKRIQDIRLTWLDSDSGSCASSEEEARTADADQDDYNDNDDKWPYEEPGSPCALFGSKIKMSSSPAEGFEGEFSSGDPEWGDQDAQSKRSTGSRDKSRSSHSNRKSSSRRLLQSQQQQQQQQQDNEDEEEDEGSDHSAGSYDLETASQSISDEEEEEEEEDDYSDESDHSVTDSPTYEDDNLMVTPAMGKAREAQRKKPPTLKRGAHQVATPSVVKAMKDKQALTVSDDEDNESIDFDAEFDSDLESASSAHSRKGRGENGSRSKRDGRYEAANNSFRRASMSKKNFKFDRSMSSADLKAARKANNSFKGHTDMNRSFSALSESKRRMNRSNSRRQDRMQNSFSASSGMQGSSRRLSSSQGKSPPPGEGKSSRKAPGRAKSMGHATAGTSKLKSALSKFSGSADEPPSASGSAGKKSYGSTLSALKVLSGADGAAEGNSGESDLKSAIMQQVYRSSSMNPLELKRKPKPKIAKTNSLSASGMARAAAASGEIFPPKDGAAKETKQGRVRRSKTVSERSASISDFGASYHESIAKMRKQKMADASERSATSQSTRSQEPKEPKESTSSTRERNVGRAKSFSHSNRSGTNLDMQEAETADASPERSSASRPRMKRGSSKRLQQAQQQQQQQPDEGELDGAGSSHSSRRNLQKSGSNRRLQKESSTRLYDASPQRPNGTSVIALLNSREPVTDSQMMQKGNRQMFHALMYKTRMGIDMEQLRQTVEGGDDGDSVSDASK